MKDVITMSMGRISPVLLLFAAAAGGCVSPDTNSAAPTRTASFSGPPDDFGDYWYQGQAEITSYDLEQARYGAIREGSAVTIFVTEDLSRKKQVKLDDPAAAGDDAVKVLKLNSVRKFNTGIYPYSIMTSVFTPVYLDRDPNTLKVTATVQEWCGHTFAQLNYRSDAYHLEHFSYFESEGDVEKTLDDVLLEDELWTLVRLSPKDLPQGEVTVLPSVVHQRLSHAEWQPLAATGTLVTSSESDALMEYMLQYKDIRRQLLIRYRKDFPHEIEYWEEKHVSGFGPDAEMMTTRGTLRKRMMTDYWTKNKPGDEALRDELAL